jgi:protein gp37
MTATKIEWTEATWNPTIGCTKITCGCKNCYAETMARRLQAIGVKGYGNGFEFTVLPDRFLQPLDIKKPTRFFVNSMSDLKQWGTWGEDGKKRSKHANGSLLLGREWKEEPRITKQTEAAVHE